MTVPKIPVIVLTGFLGSGKTTILKHLLSLDEMRDSAVLINEFGEIALDHHLVADVREDAIILASGCVCCSVRNDLVRALCELWVKAARHEIPPFRRVILETTGLADPTPVLGTLAKNGLVTSIYRRAGLVTTVDAQHAMAQLEHHPEAVKQVALADQIVVTKADLTGPEERAGLVRRLRTIQCFAPILESARGNVAPNDLFGTGKSTNGSRPSDSSADEHAHDGAGHVHDGSVRTFSIETGMLSFHRFALWLATVSQLYGGRLLRMKGILHVDDEPTPVVVQSVQHVVYPTESLPRWPSGEPRTRLIFIVQDFDDELIARFRTSIAELAPDADATAMHVP
ncbi:Putative metal chaperone, involved in Zn homeostasis [Labilithrix luteola]|uniref:Putative metal chaperone, involved in Zn homeostasis n=1 Tax=Labilithrix luteola TaxID=1391654 RepID=A0A0K1QD43_9BACT|nr:GTP-binding protein [Labilithrix luteola]AKV03340.1 Putative metal chaperone, involved in Zn homeostasis [Labilithrix luteola]